MNIYVILKTYKLDTQVLPQKTERSRHDLHLSPSSDHNNASTHIPKPCSQKLPLKLQVHPHSSTVFSRVLTFTVTH